MAIEECDEYCEVSVMKERIIERIERINDDELNFHMENGDVYKMYHEQDCCESVNLTEIIGELDHLVGSRLYMAELVTETPKTEDDFDSQTWSFYKFATLKGYVTLRWEGSSNGYYSETVDFVQIQRNRVEVDLTPDNGNEKVS